MSALQKGHRSWTDVSASMRDYILAVVTQRPKVVGFLSLRINPSTQNYRYSGVLYLPAVDRRVRPWRVVDEICAHLKSLEHKNLEAGKPETIEGRAHLSRCGFREVCPTVWEKTL